MPRVRLTTAALLGLSLPLSGCNVVSALVYFFSPPQIQKAEYPLTDGRLAVLVEVARAEEENPVFRQAFCEKLVEIFRDHKVKAKVVPQDEVLRLRQQNPDFSKWSLQKVGQHLNVQQVLYVRLDRLQLRNEPGSPILHPAVQMRLKLIDPNLPADAARLWPGSQERDGRVAERARPPVEAGDSLAVDSELAKLGKDAAWLAAMPFFDVDLERKTPWEP